MERYLMTAPIDTIEAMTIAKLTFDSYCTALRNDEIRLSYNVREFTARKLHLHTAWDLVEYLAVERIPRLQKSKKTAQILIINLLDDLDLDVDCNNSESINVSLTNIERVVRSYFRDSTEIDYLQVSTSDLLAEVTAAIYHSFQDISGFFLSISNCRYSNDTKNIPIPKDFHYANMQHLCTGQCA